ncbi:uncharacterized protein FIBRA_04246 [Fibroporia radiculosa]|uniref:P-loop containing nucleoside triphosphate hydrolase protein n=1 Tax=Fibroporia radiculosa TaxID=599839 RepID=J4G728_9APHY|nr:uncharacterized protein FIBRA_04246 [Fibroporia radiculosa]CCM02168.1 predicted protein [Fibroporia radiculosa]
MDLDDFDYVPEDVTADIPEPSSIKPALRYIDKKWYLPANRRARWMDLIGDYAGTELFILDGEALLQQVLNDPLLALGREGDPSFQILHAIHTLEKILNEFQSRSACFEIVFWQDTRHVTLLSGSSEFVTSSRILARTMLFQHLHRFNIPIHVFESVSDPEWIRYQGSTKPMFVMTNDGGNLGPNDALFTAERIFSQRIFLFDLLSLGLSVAMLHGAEYRDSKIMTFIYEQRRDHHAREHLPDGLWGAYRVAMRSLEDQESHVRHGVSMVSLKTFAPRISPSADEDWSPTKSFVQKMLSSHFLGHAFRQELLYLFLAHLLVVPTLSIRVRARQIDGLDGDLSRILLESFLPSAFISLEGLCTQRRVDIDGRVFVALLQFSAAHPDVSLTELLGQSIGQQLDAIWSAQNLPPVDIKILAKRLRSIEGVSQQRVVSRRPHLGLLPFSHPVFDKHLASVHVGVENTDADVRQLRLQFNTVFNDVYHWHNSRRSILPPHLGGEEFHPMDAKQRFRKLRSDQRFMASMEWQAKTLTGAFGIPLERLVILPVGSRAAQRTNNLVSRPAVRAIQAKPVKQGKKGKQEYVSSADKIRQANAAKKQLKEDDSNLTWWQEQLKILAQESTENQLKAVENLQRNKRTREGWLSVEVQLYSLHLEFVRWIERSDREVPAVRDQIVVRILRLVKDTFHRKDLFPAAAGIFETALSVVGLSDVVPELKASAPALTADRELNFKFIKLAKSKSRSAVHKFMDIDEDPIVWQLRLFGEYMDRSMDSQDDPRVQFKPDAWQRDVLDCLDANHSVLVVAPTSAGKTFISYYAMEQVLKNTDDGILVYVAPTKALVNQIAAEVYARFRKDLNGRSCWAIHTRDYRVHNPQNCQILVTVPEMLAIMLLSPPLAQNWTPRIKRIILDEIHTIGQQEGGAVWEQILLLAPCPVIGLSATIGQPEQFNQWLGSVQEAHGFKHTFIYHPHRYSHLRKYMYSLQGLQPGRFRGISDYSNTERLRFLHPVSLLSFGVRDLPPDFSLEASDCLTLFRAFWTLREKLDFDVQELEPSRFFTDSPVKLLRQKDILKYESALKVHLSNLVTSDSDTSRPLLDGVISHLTDPTLKNMDHHSIPPAPDFYKNLIFLLADLHSKNDLPALFFNFDRKACENMAKYLLNQLEDTESTWRDNSPEWAQKMKQWERWRSQAKARERQASKLMKQKKDSEEPQAEVHESWESQFDPEDPSPQFSFTGVSTAYTMQDLNDEIRSLARWSKIPEWAFKGLRRGIGVHHAGMNKRYRSLVESLYRLGFLKVIIATGTLALGINAPTKTSVFCADSPFLTALMYRQCAGRAGRRGFDLLGKVVFYGIAMDRCQRLVLSRLPSLGGNFPMTSTMVLRLFNLLQGSNNAEVAVRAIDSLLQLPRVSFTSEIGRQQVSHFVRFSIDYLRRAGLLDAEGNPINLFGIAAHLYYTEPGNLALVALFRRGIIHRICCQSDSFMARREFVLLMSHLFGRRYLPKSYTTDENLQALIKKSPSMVKLPPLPKDAKEVLLQHGREILGVFTSYALAYAKDNLEPETALPTDDPKNVEVTPFLEHLRDTAIQVTVRSPLVATSGLTDEFKTVHELAQTSRQGLYLNQYAIPSVHDLATGGDDADHTLNAYLLDFYIHGQTAALKRANGIRDNDVWYLLEDFTLTLKTVRAGLGQLLLKTTSGKDADDEGFEEAKVDELDDADSGYGTYASTDMEDDEFGGGQHLERPAGVSDQDWKVYEVIDSVTNEFDTKFHAMWA